jgi:branched-chain amino acid transport system substrate-binding protein
MKRSIKILLLIISLFSFCLTISKTSAEEIKIPVMVGQTGASASFGKGELDAYTLAVEEWNAKGGLNGKQIALDVEDTQTSQQQIVTAFQRIATKKPAVILGPTWLDGFQAVIQPARQQQILLVTPSAAVEAFDPELNDWPVSFYHNSTAEAAALLKGLEQRDLKKIGLIYEQEPFAEMLRKLTAQQATSPLSLELGVQGGETAFQSIIQKIKAAKLEVLLIYVWNERSLLSLLQQLRVHASELPLATVHDGEGWLSNESFKPVLPKLIFSKFIIQDLTFEERFSRRFGYAPILTASNAYDAINAVLQALASGKKTASEIRTFLLTAEHQTATFGLVKFNKDRRLMSKVSIVDFSCETKS